mmetsp:Transcript_10233/g.23965  ORF Transcript_10233/g.23965 Transcript_10233/m.23965 type:complete len:734 (+) Transcript_10233:1350-3551(+)
MLSKAHVDRFDRRSQGFHGSENQCVAKQKGDHHVQSHRRIGHAGIVSIPLVNDNGAGEQDYDTGNTSTDTSANVRGNIVVDDWFDPRLIDQHRNLSGRPGVGHLVIGHVAHGQIRMVAHKVPRLRVDPFCELVNRGDSTATSVRRRSSFHRTADGRSPHAPESSPGMIDLSYLAPHELCRTPEQSALGHRSKTNRESGFQELTDGGRTGFPDLSAPVLVSSSSPPGAIIAQKPCVVFFVTAVVLVVEIVVVAFVVTVHARVDRGLVLRGIRYSIGFGHAVLRLDPGTGGPSAPSRLLGFGRKSREFDGLGGVVGCADFRARSIPRLRLQRLLLPPLRLFHPFQERGLFGKPVRDTATGHQGQQPCYRPGRPFSSHERDRRPHKTPGSQGRQEGQPPQRNDAELTGDHDDQDPVEGFTFQRPRQDVERSASERLEKRLSPPWRRGSHLPPPKQIQVAGEAPRRDESVGPKGRGKHPVGCPHQSQVHTGRKGGRDQQKLRGKMPGVVAGSDTSRCSIEQTREDHDGYHQSPEQGVEGCRPGRSRRGQPGSICCGGRGGGIGATTGTAATVPKQGDEQTDRNKHPKSDGPRYVFWPFFPLETGAPVAVGVAKRAESTPGSVVRCDTGHDVIVAVVMAVVVVKTLVVVDGIRIIAALVLQDIVAGWDFLLLFWFLWMIAIADGIELVGCCVQRRSCLRLRTGWFICPLVQRRWRFSRGQIALMELGKRWHGGNLGER